MVRPPEDTGNDDIQDNPPSLAALSHEVKELVRLISATDIHELQLESGQVRIVIKRGMQAPAGGLAPATAAPSNSVYTPPATLPAPEVPAPLSLIGHAPMHGEEIELAAGEQLIVAPMVGTFYAAPAPNEAPYVQVGDIIEPGQPVGIIEAMKMMNEIEAEIGGRITRILVQNAQPVEYGQPLMVVQTL
jgi:acetyl-CoA carboxylase biotin carboxyl carrier protein